MSYWKRHSLAALVFTTLYFTLDTAVGVIGWSLLIPVTIGWRLVGFDGGMNLILSFVTAPTIIFTILMVAMPWIKRRFGVIF